MWVNVNRQEQNACVQYANFFIPLFPTIAETKKLEGPNNKSKEEAKG